MIVHGARPSPFVRKVLVTLEEKGLPYEQIELVPIPKTPELLAMHPLGKIPVLELDDGTFMPDSSVICLYLERVAPSPSLYPVDPAAYARALFLEEWSDTQLMDAISPVFFERFVKPRVLGQEPDEAHVAATLAGPAPEALAWLEKQMPSEGGWLVGAFSIADVAIASQLTNLVIAGESIDATRWPRTAAWLARTIRRPSFEKAMPG
jgi:glutathione S-transferase